ncbi:MULTISPECIES: peptidylprolyl isomerase [Oscillatoriales]|nr:MULTISPECIES: peptidylprolyl isomerase [Oscillatoriales]
MRNITVYPEDLIRQIKLSCQIPTFLENIATRKIITSKAKELGIKVEPEELQKSADNIRLANNLRRTDQTLAWLQKHSLSLDDLEEIAYFSVTSSKLAEHLFADKVEPFFVENLLNYAQVVMYEVILDDEDLAMELFYAIGEDEMSFHEVACQYLHDKELRRCGGYRGTLRRSDLKPEISAAVFAATPPQLIKPVVTSKGAHLIFVEEVIQPKLDATVRSKIISDLFSGWIKQQIVQTEIVLSSFQDSDAGIAALDDAPL